MRSFSKTLTYYGHITNVYRRKSCVHIIYRNLSVTCRRPAQLSYSRGPADQPLRDVTVGRLLQDQVEKTPDREAAVFHTDGVRRTFSQLLAECDKFAAGLLSIGLKKGDRVGIWGPNSLEWVITQYATARAGLILVNVNPLYRSFELEYALKLVECKCLVSAVEFKEQKYYDILCQLIPELHTQRPGALRSQMLPDLQYIVMMGDKQHPGTLRYSDIMGAGSEKEARHIVDVQDRLHIHDPINIQFTSGTTGFPKGATLSHRNIVNNSYFVGQVLDYHNRETRICVPVPLYHCFGMVLASLQMPNHGATCVFPGPGFDAGLTLNAIAKERCTSVYGVPTMFIDMLNHPDVDGLDLSSLYTGIMAGAPCPIETMKQAIEKMHVKEVTVCYGTTENSPVTFQSRRDDVIEKRISTVGQPVIHVEAKMVDEAGETVPVGTRGEIWTRGYTTMLRYWGDPQQTAEVIRSDGWYKTGDTAIMDEEGFCRIVGRLTDMIVRGGENIYPLEIEQVLYSHPRIKEVQVVGVPDARLGEAVCAWVQLKDGEAATEEEISDFCRDKVARYKVPKYVQFVDEYPMTVTGKVQKYKVREMAAKKLGLEPLSTS